MSCIVPKLPRSKVIRAGKGPRTDRMIAQSEFEEVFVISSERATFRLQVTHPNQGQPLKQETPGPQARRQPISAEAGILCLCLHLLQYPSCILPPSLGQTRDEQQTNICANGKLRCSYLISCLKRTAIVTDGVPVGQQLPQLVQYIPLGTLTGNSNQAYVPEGHA